MRSFSYRELKDEFGSNRLNIRGVTNNNNNNNG